MSEFTDNIEKGDFVYQSDAELFLVAIDTDEHNVTFAVHGWRTIDKDRLDEYLDHQHGKLFSEEKLRETVSEKGEVADAENFDMLLELMAAYRDGDVASNQMIDEYALEDK